VQTRNCEYETFPPWALLLLVRPRRRSESEFEPLGEVSVNVSPQMCLIDVNDKDLLGALNALPLVGLDDQPLKLTHVEELCAERFAIYRSLPAFANAHTALSLTCEGGDAPREHIAVIGADGKPSLVTCECQILLADVPPSELAEYSFEDNVWRLSTVCIAALQEYRQSKFDVWRHSLVEPDCEASLKRLLQGGLIFTMYDHLAFPNPPEAVANYQVKNDSGKLIDIPHPLTGLRAWNPQTKSYDAVDVRLVGAPAPEHAEAAWNEILVELRQKKCSELW